MKLMHALLLTWLSIATNVKDADCLRVQNKLGAKTYKACVQVPWDTDWWSLQLVFQEPVDSVQPMSANDDVTITASNDSRIQYVSGTTNLTKGRSLCKILRVITSSDQAPRASKALLQPGLQTWFNPGNDGDMLGRFCLTSSVDMDSWNLRMELSKATTSLEIRDAEVKERLMDGRVYLLSNMDKEYHFRRLQAGQEMCLDFTLHLKKKTFPSIRVDFDPPQARLTASVTSTPAATSGAATAVPGPTSAPAPTTTPLPPPFKLDHQWREGFTGKLCLQAPQPLCKWRIIMEVTPAIKQLNVWSARVTAVASSNQTFTVDFPTYNLYLQRGEVFCSDMLAYVTSPNSHTPDPPTVTATFDLASSKCGDSAKTTTNAPTDAPTNAPTDAPSNVPTDAPTDVPTDAPTNAPTDAPSNAPSNVPTNVPTDAPTPAPFSAQPTTNRPTTAQGSPPGATAARHNGIMGLYSQVFHGEGTYYGYSTGGLCSYGPQLPPAASNSVISKLVALNQPQLFNSLACGACFKVRGSGKGLGSSPITGEFYVFVKDVCPECKQGDLDLSESGDGRWEIEIKAVQCPVGNSKLEYKFQGSNPYYLKLQIRNGRLPTTKVEMRVQGQYRTLTHAPDNFWLLSGMGQIHTTNMEVRLIAANGQQVEDVIPMLANDQVIAGQRRVQYPLDPSLPSA